MLLASRHILLLLLLATCLTGQRAWATQINCIDLSTLNQALKSAKKHDTLIISGGYCLSESLLIDKTLHLIGKGLPILDFQEKSTGIFITADSVTIEGICVSNIKKSSINDHGSIVVEDANYARIENNAVLNGFFGIYLANSKHSVVASNYVEGEATIEQKTGNAIHLWQCDSILISGNTCVSHRDGVYLEFVTNTRVENNVSMFNIRYGLHFMFSHDDEYIHNKFLNNSAGVAVMYSKNVNMVSNIFQDNWGDASYGLLLKDITDGRLQDNVFDRNTIALLMEGTNRLAIENNRFLNNGWALKISANCEDNVLVDNGFMGNSFDVTTNGSIVMNSFDGNYWENYTGYDLDQNGVGDVPYHPVSLFSVMVETVPESLMLYRSFLTMLLDQTEHVMPSVTPAKLVDNKPLMSLPGAKEAYYAYSR